MSDYMFMLESHLTPEMFQVVSQVEAAAEQAGVNVFLTGGAMRDMMGGFPIRDLDFTVEGNPAKLVKLLVARTGAKVAAQDESRKRVELQLPPGLHIEVGMAHEATYGKPGSTPKIRPATIHEDLRGRDFTVNAIALSLNKGSRGLLLDPTNGLGDLERRELRATGNYTLYDDPARIFRLLRLKVRMKFEISERTQSQYENVREAKLEEKVPEKELGRELRAMADEPDPGTLLELYEKEKLLSYFSPVLAGPKLNLAGHARLHKMRQMIPFGISLRVANIGLFLWVLLEKLNSKERADLIKRLQIPRADVDAWQKLEAKSKKLESQLKSARLNKASLVYQLLQQAPGEQILFLAYRSQQRLVQDRIKNYLTKYLPGVMEITDREVTAHFHVEPGSPKYAKAREDYILGRLDGRIRKPEPPPPPPEPPQRGNPNLRRAAEARAAKI